MNKTQFANFHMIQKRTDFKLHLLVYMINLPMIMLESYMYLYECVATIISLTYIYIYDVLLNIACTSLNR